MQPLAHSLSSELCSSIARFPCDSTAFLFSIVKSCSERDADDDAKKSADHLYACSRIDPTVNGERRSDNRILINERPPIAHWGSQYALSQRRGAIPMFRKAFPPQISVSRWTASTDTYKIYLFFTLIGFQPKSSFVDFRLCLRDSLSWLSVSSKARVK